MAGRKKGQVSIEVLMAASILLILVILVLWQVGYRKEINNSAGNIYGNSITCSRISNIISLLASNSSENEIIIELDRSITITGQVISAGNEHCLFHGRAADAELAPGSVRIYDYNGVIYAKNV